MHDFSFWVTPNDDDVVSKTDSISIQNAVNKAHELGSNQVVIPCFNQRTGKNGWEISETILLPDDITIVIDNTSLTLADGVFCNIFRNECAYSKDRVQKNISILGVGNAVLDGGNPNGLTEQTSEKEGYPSILNNNFILFANVRGFQIKNIKAQHQRWWAFNFYYCSEGTIKDIDIFALDNVKNQDGIDIRCGCHNIVIENVKGQAGDDLIALTGLWGKGEKTFWIEGTPVDIHHCIIKNVIGTSVSKAVIALRNQDGIKLHDISLDTLIDTSEEKEENRPYAFLRIGQNTYISERPSKLGETYNICVSNLHAAKNTAVMIASTLQNASFQNIFVGNTAPCVLSVNEGATLNNILFDGVFYDVDEFVSTAIKSKNGDRFREDCGDKFAIFHFNNYGNPVLEKADFTKNFVLKNVFVNKLEKRPLLYATGNAKVTINDYVVTNHVGSALFQTEDGAEVCVN